MLAHHVVDEVAGGDGQNEAAEPVDDHQQKAAGEQPAARLDELPDLGQHLLELGFGARGGEIGRGGICPRCARGGLRACIPPPNLDGPKFEDMDTPSLRRRASFPEESAGSAQPYADAIRSEYSDLMKRMQWPTQYQPRSLPRVYARRLRRALRKERTQKRT